MIIDSSVVVSTIGQLIILAFFFGKYKGMLDKHEKLLDKHEKAIDKILDRLDAMTTDIGFIKGCMAK